MLEKASWKKQKLKVKPLTCKISLIYRKLIEEEWGI